MVHSPALEQNPRATQPVTEVALVCHSTHSGCQPLQTGVPFPRGTLQDPKQLGLFDKHDFVVPFQGTVLARWADGSVKWLLAEWVPGHLDAGESRWALRSGGPQNPRQDSGLRLQETGTGFRIDTGNTVFDLDRRQAWPLREVPGRWLFRDASGKPVAAQVEKMLVEATGPVRVTLCVTGRFGPVVRFTARYCFFAGTGLVRVRFTLHNPRRARHRGGLWDLGDPGSILFRELALALSADGTIHYNLDPDAPLQTANGSVEIFQGSSGGANWRSNNHVDRSGQVALPFRGCRVRGDGAESYVHRPHPTIASRRSAATIAAAIPEFWQQFPKCLEATTGELKVGLFPGQCETEHELQGGEQKTHTFWLQLSPSDDAPSLQWVHAAARIQLPAEWLAESGALPAWAFPEHIDLRLENLLENAIEGAGSLSARREIIDEYGWRHFGDLYADHEAAYYSGPPPVISHYNNQYDVIYGTLLQYLRTGDDRWLDLSSPLARHVIDIDIYHTDQDKPAYNGGLFWHTDHYRDAASATHRSYSKANQAPGKSYGGGPCNEHNYTTGLLHHYYFTGNPLARDAVLSLADWVINMDDGRANVFGLIDDGPTGHASRTTEANFHGPGRGCGNSINALLDAWLLTDDRRYLGKAEELVRRSIHPRDDIAARNLLNAEMRWSYTVFLTVLARYLDLKAHADQVDEAYSYAQASLLHYAEWMAANEVPYFDHPEKLEFPTETWAAQEMRKANVLRLASAHASGPLRDTMLRRATELAERAWHDLLRFEQPATLRSLALLFVEGLKDSWFRESALPPAPVAARNFDPGDPQPFVGQRARVLKKVRSPRGLAATLLRLADPRGWWRFVRGSDKTPQPGR